MLDQPQIAVRAGFRSATSDQRASFIRPVGVMMPGGELMRKLSRSDTSLDLVRPFSTFCQTQALSTYHAEVIKKFAEQVERGLSQSVAKPHRIEGIRAEMIFQTVVAGLGDVRLLKAEDAGDVFCDENIAIPDFTIVTKSGDRLLVEVKLHGQACKDMNRYEFRISDKMMQSYLAYAKLNGGELMFGIFWEAFQMWTLNTVRAFQPGVAGESKWSLKYMRAMATNEFHRLGDFYLAIAPPLRFRLYCDPQPMPEGQAQFTATMKIARAEILSRNQVLTGKTADFAWRLMNYGAWPPLSCSGMVEDGMLLGFQYIFGPSNPESDGDAENPEFWNSEIYSREVSPRDLALFAPLSTLISRQYLHGAGSTIHTLSGDSILDPGAGQKFIPDEPEIAIVRLIMQPNYDLLIPETPVNAADDTSTTSSSDDVGTGEGDAKPNPS